MIFARFRDLLKQTMGLDSATVGTSAIERAVQARILACRSADADEYWAHVTRSRIELQELIEAVVVPETWFFRDPQAFAAMARIAIEEWLPRGAAQKLRMLSLPCSTGEEPYTMAMALIDAGLPPARFRIDAMDISGQALERARRGVYGRNSFRGKDLAYRDRHFVAVDGEYRISEAVRGSVHFTQGNLFEASSPTAERYDIIFCRNLLIYFDAATQARAIGVLNHLLVAGGVLFVGHAETGLPVEQGFRSAKIAMAFAFRKSEAVPRPPRQEAPPAQPRLQPFASPPPRAPRRPTGFTRRVPPPERRPGIEEFRRMADQGRFAEAAQGCEAYLRQSGPSPDALHLLGLINDAAGNLAGAAEYYRKTLYLEPDHHEALGHLALLLKKQGDTAAAKILADRLRRLDGKAAR